MCGFCVGSRRQCKLISLHLQSCYLRMIVVSNINIKKTSRHTQCALLVSGGVDDVMGSIWPKLLRGTAD